MHHYRRRLLGSSLLAGVALLAAPAWAQDSAQGATVEAATTQSANDPAASPADSSAQGNETGGDIVVTGSRIQSPVATAASPVQVISAEQIRQSGVINVQDLLLQNPGSASRGSAAPTRPSPRRARASRRSTCATWARTARWCWSTGAASSRACPARPRST